ncbi:MAG: hypothetical protein ACT4OK_21215 [Gemmobacter sp.]
MIPLRPDDLDRLAAGPSDLRLVRLALTAAAREIAFLRGHAMDAAAGPLFPGPAPATGWHPAGLDGQRAVAKTYRDRLIWAD